MADIFASPSKDSLFSMRVSLPAISKEEYHQFYKKDRTLFTTLLLVLHHDAVQSILLIGFILWLERGGYFSKNLVVTILNSLNLRGIERLANHVVICLKLLDTKKPANFISADISGLQCFLDRNCLTLEEIYLNRDSIIQEVSCIPNEHELSSKAFDDILERFIRIFGDFIETISMQQVEPRKQPLCARLVAGSQSMVSVVIIKDGPDGKSIYYINGKYVFPRKSLKRASSKVANLGV